MVYIHTVRATVMDRFSVCGSDASDKPPSITAKCDKLGGHAVQNWVFLRLLPLFIGRYVEDFGISALLFPGISCREI